jgi:hypothetical protein
MGAEQCGEGVRVVEDLGLDTDHGDGNVFERAVHEGRAQTRGVFLGGDQRFFKARETNEAQRDAFLVCR